MIDYGGQLRHRIGSEMRVSYMALRAVHCNDAVNAAAPPDFDHVAKLVGIGRLTDDAIIDHLAARL